MNYRIVAGGIHIESSTFTPYISDEKDFTIRENEVLMGRYPFIKDFKDVELIPLIHAGALPGGVVSRKFYNEWFEKFATLLKEEINKAPVQGVLMDIHGAMSLEGTDDAEGDLLEEVRKIVGPDVAISTSMDLHGNVSDKLFKATDLLTCYRTAPHIDTVETRERAFKNLLEIIKNGRKNLVRTKVNIPILLPGEKTSTEVEPGKSLYLEIERILEDKELLDTSIYMGFPWADQPRCQAVVTTLGYNREKTEKASLNLAEKFWDLRDDFKFVGPVAKSDVAIEMAFNAKEKPFFISDTGDNPGAGGADDMVVFLREFIEEYINRKSTKRILFASIKDEETVNKIYENKVGENLELHLGGKIDPSFGGPLNKTFKIIRLFETKEAGKAAVIAIGNFEIIVTSKRHQYSRKQYFEEASINSFNEYDIIIVKIGYLEPDLSAAQKGWVMALTPGAVDQDIEHLKFLKLKKPLYPINGSDFNPDLKAETIESESIGEN